MLETMLDPDVLAPERIRPLSRREYDKLVELGAFEDERIELLRGQLVEMSPQGPSHSQVTARLGQRLIRALDDKLYDVRQHSPFAASDDSEPEPDISVALRRKSISHPGPRHALLLIEVAESSLRKDREVKAAIYAEARVPEYWIIDLKTKFVWVFREPQRGVYQDIARRTRRDTLRPLRLPRVRIKIGDLFR